MLVNVSVDYYCMLLLRKMQPCASDLCLLNVFIWFDTTMRETVVWVNGRYLSTWGIRITCSSPGSRLQSMVSVFFFLSLQFSLERGPKILSPTISMRMPHAVRLPVECYMALADEPYLLTQCGGEWSKYNLWVCDQEEHHNQTNRLTEAWVLAWNISLAKSEEGFTGNWKTENGIEVLKINCTDRSLNYHKCRRSSASCCSFSLGKKYLLLGYVWHHAFGIFLYSYEIRLEKHILLVWTIVLKN